MNLSTTIKENPEYLFFGSVVIGAAGLALLLSPGSGVFALWVIAFAAESIRAGLVLINVKVRKISMTQYAIVLCAAILATVGVGFAIDGITERYSMEWWAGQTINFLILAGEYSWAVIEAGVKVDWEFEHSILSGKLRKASEEVEKLSEQVEDYEKATSENEADYSVALERIELLSKECSDYQKKLSKQQENIKRLLPIANSLVAVREKKISVNRVATQVCPNCDVLIAPPSNSHKPDNCPECNEELKWNRD